MDLLARTIYAREAFLHMSVWVMDLLKNYVPFVCRTDARKALVGDLTRRYHNSISQHLNCIIDQSLYRRYAN
jgi:hypothetical protein